ncbi:hypothetical protein [Amycolatopsis magusensis]|uniref:hypothetical protein n=1 Tax=Amycolatopsis magusensis TaxID=882444 RepID=UPI0037B10253
MRSAHISRRWAEAELDGFDWDDVSGVQEAAALAFERFEIATDADMDELVQSTELVLTANEQAELNAFLYGTAGARDAHRTRRRTARELLRSNFLVGGMASQGKSAAMLLLTLTDGEAA